MRLTSRSGCSSGVPAELHGKPGLVSRSQTQHVMRVWKRRTGCRKPEVLTRTKNLNLTRSSQISSEVNELYSVFDQSMEKHLAKLPTNQLFFFLIARHMSFSETGQLNSKRSINNVMRVGSAGGIPSHTGSRTQAAW